ncbi:MAG: Rossmann fold nucleotide-binding protein [Deltaproteobacteria bacterium]|nr:Rossmann fold nucleotide-binding protein [Deltaproteobacteria bacterium]
MNEVEKIEDFDTAMTRTGPVVAQGVDLRGRTEALVALAQNGHRHVMLGCAMEPHAMAALITAGSVVLPAIEGFPFSPFRAALYEPDELFAQLAQGYDNTPDAQAYRWYCSERSSGNLLSAMAMALHDQSMGDALDQRTCDRPVVGVMGGHAVRRGTEAFASAARLGRVLARAGRVVLTGGGPGAMEAANLGAHLAHHEDAALDDACAMLAERPSYTEGMTEWARAAMAVRAKYAAPSECLSVGIPTWFYGHEPPNAFAGRIAKYFSNALREDGILTRATGGIAFLPGAAGTVQELFQDATQNYYAGPGQAAKVVLIGRAHWTEKLPAWQLLSALASGREMADKIHLVDTIEQASALLT